ncbi:MAG: class I SAM-dependent methyltransferase [Saprospiraceae bacterium]|nr:class I SAM-dependent methyltransferase [Saprospiraceae bacterium]
MYDQPIKVKNNEYSACPNKYLKSRPDYGIEIFDFLATVIHDNNLAWDCATGNGQAAKTLAKYFNNVIATDASESQLKKAVYKENITYLQTNELNPHLENNSVDLITVASAIHWMDQKLFYEEARRVLKPNGTIAIWGYTGKNINKSMDSTLDSIINKHLKPYYSDNINMAFSAYSNLDFPFKKIESPIFITQKLYQFSDLVDYILSWSASQKYLTIHNQSPLFLFEDELKSAWGDLTQKKLMTWNLNTYIGTL